MKDFQVLYLPIGVPTFHLESAQKEFDASVKLLKSVSGDVCVPAEMLLSLDKLNAFMNDKDPDLLVIQNITFANAAYTQEILHRFPGVPILLWTLREPVIDGGRLRLNSLTGAYSAANTIKAFGLPFEYIFGSPKEENVKQKIADTVAAAELKRKLRSLKLAAIGHTPTGFGFGRATDAELLRTFGVRLESIEARELINQAKSFSDEECEEYLKKAESSICGLENTPEKNRHDFAHLYKAYEEYVRQNGIGAIASRCWPDFFVDYGTPVCSVLGMLNDEGIAASCETDTFGALSMYMGSALTGSPSFFGDPVSLDETENTVSFWHCGTAACSLARDGRACAGEHCNRHIGPTLEFGCRPCPRVTVFRVGKTPDGAFRFIIAGGEALDKPQQFLGTSVVVKLDHSARDFVEQTVAEGCEPHYVVVYGDAAEPLAILAKFLKIEVMKLN